MIQNEMTEFKKIPSCMCIISSASIMMSEMVVFSETLQNDGFQSF